MANEIIKDVAQLFIQKGFEIFEVGGSVRDSILGRKSSDVDFAVSCKPDKTLEILKEFCGKNKGYSCYTVGMDFGTIGLISDDGQKYEFTTYRGEVYPADSRKPIVNFGTNLLQDLSRRDFTINALARYPINGNIIDEFNGLRDIKNKTIRCVGSDERLNEDPLRMMRAIRFACQLGFDLDILIANPERLKVISNERIRDELNKILLSSNSKKGIQLLCHKRLMQYIIPELLDLQGLEQGHAHITDAFNHTLMVLNSASKKDYDNDNLVFRLAALLHDIGKPKSHTITETGHHFYSHHLIGYDLSKGILTRLAYDNSTIDRVSNLVLRHMEPLLMSIGDGLNKKSVGRLMRRFNNDNQNDINMLIDLVECDLGSTSQPNIEMINVLRQMISEIQVAIPKQKSPISGDEIMEALNLKPGKIIGEIKDYLLDCISEGLAGANDKDTLLKLARDKYYEN
ncbi:MAG: HD domain-containing protein [Lutibacter sp.]|jgi:putative nucleotidyltransferase with HDIG domain